MLLKKVIFIVALLCTCSTFSNAQEFSNSSIKFNIGVGSQRFLQSGEVGTVYSLGYIKKSNNGRVRYNPNIKIGGYSPIITDSRYREYRSSSFEFNTSLDIFKFDSFSFFGGIGGLFNYSRGHIFTEESIEVVTTIADDLVYTYYYKESTEYFDEFFGGAIFSLGFRIDKPTKRVAYEIIPFNYSIGNNDFRQYHFTFGFDVKF